jgi:hypothetical protein
VNSTDEMDELLREEREAREREFWDTIDRFGWGGPPEKED